MKIVGFEANGGLHLGVVEGDQVIDLQAVDKSIPSDLGECLRRNNGDLSALKDAAKRAPASAHRPLKGLKYALPVATPGKIICLGLNYLDHVKEGSQRDNIPKFPTIFMRGNTSLVPHGQPIIRPKVSETLDYEAELIFIVGKRAKHLTLENAYSCIAGYSCGNEGSVREFQRKTTQWDMGKNFDRTGGFGPWMVTADEVPPGGKGLKIQTRLNGTGHAVGQHRQHDVPGRRDAGLRHPGHHARAGRHHLHRHAVGRRPCAQAEPGVDEAGRHLRDRDRGHRRACESRSRTRSRSPAVSLLVGILHARKRSLDESAARNPPTSDLAVRPRVPTCRLVGLVAATFHPPCWRHCHAHLERSFDLRLAAQRLLQCHRAAALPSLAPEGMTIRPAPSFAEFPLYNADIQNSSGFPAAVNTLADAIRAADGVIFCTPEYNFTIPGGLKNAIDWVSRVQNQPFAGKPVALQSASPGPVGGAPRAIRYAQGDDVSRRLHAQQAGNLHRQLRLQARRDDRRDQGRDDARLHQAAACRASRPSSREWRRRPEDDMQPCPAERLALARLDGRGSLLQNRASGMRLRETLPGPGDAV